MLLEVDICISGTKVLERVCVRLSTVFLSPSHYHIPFEKDDSLIYTCMQLRIPYFIFGQILIQKVTLRRTDNVQQ